MKPVFTRAGESSPPPAQTTWREQFARETRSEELSAAEKRRRRKARTQARIGSAEILWDRERTIDEQKVQIREHARCVQGFRR